MSELLWKLRNAKNPEVDIAFAVFDAACRMVAEQTPDLQDLFPFRNKYQANAFFAEGWVAFVINWEFAPGIPTIGKIPTEGADPFRTAALAGLVEVSHQTLRQALAPDAFSVRKFSYLGPHREGSMNWGHLQQHLVDWMNAVVLPEVLAWNETRILRAIPPPPSFTPSKILPALWVLECDETAQQGTAFALEGSGLITCDHVLGPRTIAFRPDEPSRQRKVRIVARNPTIDLAILEFENWTPEYRLHRGTADTIERMAHVAIAGFPNFRVGDTGTFVPGLVVGFRVISSIRRILTNAPIITGVSGGPVVDATDAVIGVAVTGADSMNTACETEHHGIIPIDALKLLEGLTPNTQIGKA